jgi:hypothetical protein
LNSAEIYDPKTGKFTPASPMNDPRFKLSVEAVAIGIGKLLVAGGSREGFDQGNGKFLVAAGQMNDARHFMTETRLNDGTVLLVLAGGYPDNDQATALTWIFRP